MIHIALLSCIMLASRAGFLNLKELGGISAEDNVRLVLKKEKFVQVLLALSEDHCVFSENSRIACSTPRLLQQENHLDRELPYMERFLASMQAVPAAHLSFHDVSTLPSPLLHRCTLPSRPMYPVCALSKHHPGSCHFFYDPRDSMG
jgi:hypothetical protein